MKIYKKVFNAGLPKHLKDGDIIEIIGPSKTVPYMINVKKVNGKKLYAIPDDCIKEANHD